MKSFRIGELKTLLGLFQSYTGWQVQEIESSKRQIHIQLYKKEKVYLLIDLIAHCPLILLSKNKFPVSKATTPMLLFLKKYLSGLRLKEVGLGEGRVLLFIFEGAETSLTLEMRLFPHGQNLIATTAEKSLSWFKPKELPSSHYDEPQLDVDPWDLMTKKLEEYSESKEAKPKKQKPQKSNEQIMESLQKALQDESRLHDYDQAIQDISQQKNIKEICSKFKLDENLEWYELLTALKEKRQKEVSKKKKLVKRMEEIKRQEERQSAPRSHSDLKAHRYLLLKEGKRALIGKSGKDNWNLLRKAKPWFLWLHLRDLPSAHVIVEKGKKQQLSSNEIIEVGNWLIENTSLSKTTQEGDAFDIQYSECRYIRIPKGAKSGTVLVQQEQVLRFHYKRD